MIQDMNVNELIEARIEIEECVDDLCDEEGYVKYPDRKYDRKTFFSVLGYMVSLQEIDRRIGEIIYEELSRD